MSKWGVNQRAVDARDRKKAEKQRKQDEIERKREDERWKETDKNVLEKQSRKTEAEQKKEAEKQRKLENKALYEEEQKAFTTNKSGKPNKKSHFDIQNQRKAMLASLQAQIKQDDPHTEDNLDKNINPNHAYRDQVAQGIEVHEARNIDEAISALSVTDLDKHPEKRMKAAWNKFIDDHYEEYRQEYPSMRRKQIINKMSKDWEKSGENPMNQVSRPYNS